MDVEPGEEVYFHGHPSWRSLPGLWVKGSVLALAVGVAAGIATIVADDHVVVGWVIVAVVAVFTAVTATAQLRRARTTYLITDRRLAIETGIAAKELRQARLDRVQNVTARQSLGERMLGIGSVVFDTAGDVDGDFAFRGVGAPREIVRVVDGAQHARGRAPATPV